MKVKQLKWGPYVHNTSIEEKERGIVMGKVLGDIALIKAHDNTVLGFYWAFDDDNGKASLNISSNIIHDFKSINEAKSYAENHYKQFVNSLVD